MRWLFILFVLVFPVCTGALDLQQNYFDLSVAAGVTLPGVIKAAWYEDFDPDHTVAFATQVSPLARVSLTWWPFPKVAWVAPTFSLHYAALLLPAPIRIGYWDGREHVIPDNGIHFVEFEAGVRGRAFLSDSLTVDPAFLVGYCQTYSTSLDARNRGLILNAVADLRWWRAGWQPIATVGLMMQAYGGVTGIVYIRSYPVAYAAVGVGF